MAIDLRDLERLIAEKDFKTVRAELNNLQDADIAAFMEELRREHVVMVFRSLPKDRAAEIFSYLPSDMQQYIVEAITDQEISNIINDLFMDDAADFLEEMPANVVKRVLRNASPDVRELINHFLKYPPYSAGSIMTAEFVDLRKTMTVAEAFQRIRRTALDKETVYTCYVMDDNRRLEGVVTVRELFLAEEDAVIGDIMEKNVIFVRTGDDQEEVAALLSKYNFMSLPVVDEENRLVGIVTFDDIMEVIHQEATEDFQKMAAMVPSEKPYLKTSVFSLAKNRVIWLMILMLSATVTGSILGKYEAAFVSLPVLVTFIPMLTDTGGNTGSQSSTLVIRGIALNELSLKDVGRILRKELAVSSLVGLALSTANFLRVLLVYPGSYTMAFAVSLALYATVILAATIGSMLPLAAKAIKTDPALMAAPVVTTLVDAAALIIYFKIVDLLLL
ncbi:MAG TPA: magnesium transporter [Limnochordia bacterium]|nr:magnesium transporter [Limnochordia bacterium]HPU64560.1 magnesium transporter [Limnochordia bacterium]